MSTKVETKLRPLIPRPGARYTCFGDGLCCTDIHGIGPLSEAEVDEMKSMKINAADWDDEHEDLMMCTAADGGCVFLLEDQRCSIHADFGEDRKPVGCRRFPLGLVGTPLGGRITTDHRCPCRTMGERPDITPVDAEPSLFDEDGDLEDDRRINKIPLSKKKKIKFAEWLPMETELLAKLNGERPPEEVLDAQSFPKLKDSTWEDQAREFLDAKDGTQFGVAMAWVGDTILHLQDGERFREPARPWAAAFDRAEARSPNKATADQVLADWVADEIWSLKWAEDHDFDVARRDYATRLVIARSIIERLIAKGCREDRAAAEAVLMVEIVGESDFWTEIQDCIRDTKRA